MILRLLQVLPFCDAGQRDKIIGGRRVTRQMSPLSRRPPVTTGKKRPKRIDIFIFFAGGGRVRGVLRMGTRFYDAYTERIPPR